VNYACQVAAMLLLIACGKEMPTVRDGNFNFVAVWVDTLGVYPVDPVLGFAPVAGEKITLESTVYAGVDGENQKIVVTSSADGTISFGDLPAAEYLMYSEFRRMPVSSENDSIDVGSALTVQIPGTSSSPDTVYTMSVPPGLVINEVYATGPPNTAFYFYDQFIELCNASNETVYLDGMFLCRGSQMYNPDMERNDFVQALYVFQFPGTPLTGKMYPLEPGGIVVIAGDAYDHSRLIPTAVDLTGAEWEFYNPIAGEPDNPAGNVVNILPDRTVDFMISLTHGTIFLTDGSAWEYGDFYTSGSRQYVHLPISTVIDAVEYSSSVDSEKALTRRLDNGFAGVGIQKYSGQSTERRRPGFDTNNSFLDFVVRDIPTPGY
jgi:hypothetical protein